MINKKKNSWNSLTSIISFYAVFIYILYSIPTFLELLFLYYHNKVCYEWHILYLNPPLNPKEFGSKLSKNVWMKLKFEITNALHPSILLYALNPILGGGAIPGYIRWESGYTLDRSKVHHRATQRRATTQAHTHAHTHSYGQFRVICWPNMDGGFLDDGRKPGRTSKLHKEKPQLGFEPGTLLLSAVNSSLIPVTCKKHISKKISG